MKNIDSLFSGVASKLLSAVDAPKNGSNQHEVGGLVNAGLDTFLGRPVDSAAHFKGHFFYIDDDPDENLYAKGDLSWYDSRSGKTKRGAEYRLYYPKNAVTDCMQQGDLLIVGVQPKLELCVLLARGGSTAANTLGHLFGARQNPGSRFKAISVKETDLDITRTFLFESLGIETSSEPEQEDWTDLITARFGLEFPTTRLFSDFARETLGDVELIDEPDHTLLEWMRREEALFKVLEKLIIKERLAEGFEEVDDFISFSLSVQNRRKSRAGLSFESHLGVLFEAHGLEFQRGAVTENKSKPDFLFPGSALYHTEKASSQTMLMLGAKTSCKDRWRQVLSEAEKIPNKHLVTVQPGISKDQVSEMRSHGLQLVVPEPLHATYPGGCREHLMSVGQFIDLAQELQSTRGDITQGEV